MTQVNRRNMLTGAAALAGATAVGLTSATRALADDASAPLIVTPADARYGELVTGYNQRWAGTPDSIRYPRSVDEVVKVVQQAVATGKRLAVRSGGHCYADFVTNSAVRILVDMSTMDRVYFDSARGAFCAEAGARLGAINEHLYRGYGVCLPAGICTTVGIGGHASGGGFGLLSRQFGMVADYVEAVEVVTVGQGGLVRKVIASRDPSDPHHDLWWATTGGGGGSFGVVTRFWFRGRDAKGNDPSELLPKPPRSVLVSTAAIGWSQIDRDTFFTIMKNYAAWHEKNSDPSSRGAALCAVLFIKPQLGIGLMTQVDAGIDDASGLLSSYCTALTQGTDVNLSPSAPNLKWLTATRVEGMGTLLYDPTQRSAVKTAWMRKGFTDEQLGIIHESLTRPGLNPNALLQLISVGGAMNATSRTATASAHRDSVMFAEFEAFWPSAADDDTNIAWLRDIYHGTFAATGGYPVSGERFDGSYINNPDPDITDPNFNKSGVPWSTLYFGENYPRLQRAKARWDPTDFFRHAQSVRLP